MPTTVWERKHKRKQREKQGRKKGGGKGERERTTILCDAVSVIRKRVKQLSKWKKKKKKERERERERVCVCVCVAHAEAELRCDAVKPTKHKDTHGTATTQPPPRVKPENSTEAKHNTTQHNSNKQTNKKQIDRGKGGGGLGW